MIIIKVSLFCLLALSVRAEKKIELQDIEEDNLKSEKQVDVDTTGPEVSDSGSASIPLDVFKSGFLRYFPSPKAAPQPPRYIQQYDVTEPPVEEPRQHYDFIANQQAVIGYNSNVPMQVYLVPQYYNDVKEPTANQHTSAHYSSPTGNRVAAYRPAPAPTQTQTNYVEVPPYVAPTTKTTYIQQQPSIPIAYFTYTEPANTRAHPTAAPAVSYQSPVVQYTTSVAHQNPPKDYVRQNYQSEHYTGTNNVEEAEETVEQSPHHYPTHTEIIYNKSQKPEFTRLYSSHAPTINDFHHKHIVEVPQTSQIIYKPPVQHVPNIPKVLPLQRPITKVYSSSDQFVPQTFTHRPSEPYGPPFNRRPTSLLDSYIPSSVQIEYMKRGFAKDPLEAYEALSSGRHLYSAPRHFERGFLPNQMYHTASGGVTFGHYKRSAKLNKSPHY